MLDPVLPNVKAGTSVPVEYLNVKGVSQLATRNL